MINWFKKLFAKKNNDKLQKSTWTVRKNDPRSPASSDNDDDLPQQPDMAILMAIHDSASQEMAPPSTPDHTPHTNTPSTPTHTHSYSEMPFSSSHNDNSYSSSSSDSYGGYSSSYSDSSSSCSSDSGGGGSCD